MLHQHQPAETTGSDSSSVKGESLLSRWGDGPTPSQTESGTDRGSSVEKFSVQIQRPHPTERAPTVLATTAPSLSHRLVRNLSPIYTAPPNPSGSCTASLGNNSNSDGSISPTARHQTQSSDETLSSESFAPAAFSGSGSGSDVDGIISSDCPTEATQGTTSTVSSRLQHDSSSIESWQSSVAQRKPATPSTPACELSNLQKIVVHKDLVGKATYIPFTDFQPPPAMPQHPHTELSCLFMGQLPFNVSPEMIVWLVHRFAQRPVYNVEHALRLVHTVSRGPVRLPSGCARAYCHSEDRDHIVDCLHERLLCDAGGVWMAATPAEVEAIRAYCQHLRMVARDRARGFPYRVITVEPAKRATKWVPKEQPQRGSTGN